MNDSPTPLRVSKPPHAPLPGRILLKAVNELWYFRAEQLDEAPFDPCPRIPFNLIHRSCGWLSVLWQHYRRVGCVLFYWSAVRRHWVMDVPPQHVSERDFRCDLTYAGFVCPDRNHLLAGSVSSTSEPLGPADHVIPPFDGFHFVQDVTRGLVVLNGFVRSQGDTVPVSAPTLVDIPPDPHWAQWTQRVRLTEAL